MHAMKAIPVRWQTCMTMLIGAVVVLAFSAACGSGTDTSEDAGFQKIDPSDRTYTFDDVLATGFRKSKQYDVEGLPGAMEARFGFWGLDPYNRKDCEIRFYATHEDAVELGTEPADQITGTDDIMANKDTLEWREGWKEWWFRASGIMTFSDVMGKHNAAKYGDFAILGNMVMLCEGEDSAQSLERCELFVKAIRDAAAE